MSALAMFDDDTSRDLTGVAFSLHLGRDRDHPLSALRDDPVDQQLTERHDEERRSGLADRLRAADDELDEWRYHRWLYLHREESR